MFDDFRNAINDDNLEEDQEKTSVAPFDLSDESEEPAGVEVKRPRRALPKLKVPREVMGMTPFQNFVIALLLFLMVVVSGFFFLLLTGRMAIF